MNELNNDDINNLKPFVGSSLSYSNLCKLFNQDTHTHNSITAQIRQWETYFKLVKCGSKYKIIEIYDTPFPRHLTFSQYIIAIALLSKCIKYSILDLQHYFGFTNSNYVQFYKTPKDKIDENDNDNEILINFLKDYKSLLYNKFYEAKSELLSFGYNVNEKIIVSNTTEEGDEIEENDCYHKYRYPTPTELSYIEEIGNGILKLLKCKDKRDVIIHKKSGAFYRRLNIALRNAYSIEYKYTEYEFNNQNIKNFNELYEHYIIFQKAIKISPLETMTNDEIYNYIFPIDYCYSYCKKFILENNLVLSSNDIKYYIYQSRLELNNDIIKLVRKHNAKFVKLFNESPFNRTETNPIIAALKKIYGDLDEQQYAKKYEELLESYIDKYVKLTPQTDNYYNNIQPNDFSIINDIENILQLYPDSYLYFNS